jgi:hypothetical protein
MFAAPFVLNELVQSMHTGGPSRSGVTGWIKIGLWGSRSGTPSAMYRATSCSSSGTWKGRPGRVAGRPLSASGTERKPTMPYEWEISLCDWEPPP